jgi:hypothetical protein
MGCTSIAGSPLHEFIHDGVERRRFAEATIGNASCMYGEITAQLISEAHDTIHFAATRVEVDNLRAHANRQTERLGARNSGSVTLAAEYMKMYTFNTRNQSPKQILRFTISGLKWEVAFLNQPRDRVSSMHLECE